MDEKREAVGYEKYHDGEVGKSVFGPLNEMPLSADREEEDDGEEPNSGDPFEEGEDG